MKSLPFAALLMTMLSGCSLFQVHTNLDKENFTEYFKPGSVTVLEKHRSWMLMQRRLGQSKARLVRVKALRRRRI